MAVLEEDPVAVDLALSNQRGGLASLPRAQTHNPEPVAHTLPLSVIANLLHRVNTLAQHEYDWVVRQRRLEQRLHRADWADGVLRAQIQL